jgi:stress response protein YsnF
MNLELTKEQAEELADLLDISLRNLSSEIADTDNRGYRAKLVARRERLAEVAAALGALLRPDGPLLESWAQELSQPAG